MGKVLQGAFLVLTVLLICHCTIVDANAAEKIKSRDVITFGVYEQDNNLENGKEPIEWIVLSINDNRALLLSRYGIDNIKYNKKYEVITWEKCSLRKWLNKEFYNTAFSEDEKNAINKSLIVSNDNNETGRDGVNDTKDKVFLLSYDDVTNPSYGFSNFNSLPDINRRCVPTEYAKAQGLRVLKYFRAKDNQYTCKWWLRTPGDSYYEKQVVYFDGILSEARVSGGDSGFAWYLYEGDHSDYTSYRDVAVRPAIWLNLDKGIKLINHIKPDRPIITAATDNNRIDISISETYNADGYCIYMKSPGKKKYKKIKTLKTNGQECRTFSVKNIKEGQYSFKVKAYHDADGERLWSSYSKPAEVNVGENQLAIKFKNAKEGDIIALGVYDQDFDYTNGEEPIEWIVLSKEESRMLLLSKYVIESRKYNESYSFIEWEDCALRAWLNKYFYNKAFSKDEKLFIQESTVNNYGDITKDKVFLLSIDDIRNEQYGFSDSIEADEKRICSPTQHAFMSSVSFERNEDGEKVCPWYILWPYGQEYYYDSFVEYNGSLKIAFFTMGYHFGIRPAMWVSLE